MKAITKCIGGALIIGILAGCAESTNTKQGTANQEIETSALQLSPDQSE